MKIDNSNRNISSNSSSLYQSNLHILDALYGPWNSFKEFVDSITLIDNSESEVETFINNIPLGLTIGILESDKIVEYWKPENGGFVKKNIFSDNNVGSDEIGVIKSDVSTLKTDVGTLKSSNATLTSEIDKLNIDIDFLKNNNLDNELVISTSLNELNNRLKKIESKSVFDVDLSDVSTLKTDVDTLKSSNATLTSGMKGLKDSVSNLNSLIDSLNDEIINNELVVSTSLNELNNRIKILENKIFGS